MSLWLGAGTDFGVAALLAFAPTVVARQLHLDANPFYSGVTAVLSATLGAVALVAAYAPHGNRRLIRILATVRLALGAVLWQHLEPAGRVALMASGWQLSLAVSLLLGLRLARL